MIAHLKPDATLRHVVLFLLVYQLASAATAADAPATDTVVVTDFLPAGFVRDGSMSYQPQLQTAIDSAAAADRDVKFPPMTYLLDNAAGLRVSSNLTLWMHGARFVLSPDMHEDGQAFRGEAVQDVRFFGGEIVGRNDQWPTGTNIRGIYLTGECRSIRIADMTLRDLSSNGVGVFGVDAEHRASDVWLVDTVIDNCCNVYGDYQAPPGELRGPEKGSVREDQGSVAFYFVDDFVVRGCRFEDSRSDGTHFYRCRNGHFTDNRVYRAKMGGYFIETCEHVLATNNIIRDNGSRGVTIERGSRACTLINNTVENSGREGLWMPDCLHCIVSDNLFLRNGRKPNGKTQIWNANVTIDESRNDPSGSPAQHCTLVHNVIETGADQIAAIRIGTADTMQGIVVEGNFLVGENHKILIDGDFPDRVRVSPK